MLGFLNIYGTMCRVSIPGEVFYSWQSGNGCMDSRDSWAPGNGAYRGAIPGWIDTKESYTCDIKLQIGS